MSPFWFLCVFVCVFFCDRQLVIVHSCLVVPPHPCCSLLAHIELIEEETKLILIKHESSFSFAESCFLYIWSYRNSGWRGHMQWAMLSLSTTDVWGSFGGFSSHSF